MIRGAIIAAALLSAAPAQSAEIKTGLELLVACSPTETSPQSAYDSCLAFIINGLSRMNLPDTVFVNGHKLHCPTMRTKEQYSYWLHWMPKEIRTLWGNDMPSISGASADEALKRTIGIMHSECTAAGGA